MQKDCSDKPRFPPQLKKLSKYHVRLLTKRTVSLNQLTFDHWVVAAVVPLVRAIAAMRCHCQLLLYGCHCSCEIHFLCLNTLCQGRKDPNYNLLCPVFDREHLTANGCLASSQPSDIHLSWTACCLSQWLHFLYTGLHLLYSSGLDYLPC